MVEAVSAITLQSNTPRSQPQASSASVTVVPAPVAEANFVTSHIRVDNLQNVAILEYLSSSTGEVVRQYPSQSQISAFKRAQQLEVQKVTAPPPAVSSSPVPAAPTADHAPAAPSAPAAPAAPAPSSGDSSPAPQSTQSVLA